MVKDNSVTACHRGGVLLLGSSGLSAFNSHDGEIGLLRAFPGAHPWAVLPLVLEVILWDRSERAAWAILHQGLVFYSFIAFSHHAEHNCCCFHKQMGDRLL